MCNRWFSTSGTTRGRGGGGGKGAVVLNKGNDKSTRVLYITPTFWLREMASVRRFNIVGCITHRRKAYTPTVYISC